MRCPNCGSSAQPKVVSTEYHEDGWDIEVVRGTMYAGAAKNLLVYLAIIAMVAKL